MRKWRDLFSDCLFQLLHDHQLVFNTCWEDPWIDRQLLDLQADSRVVMITSAGCNALEYLLDGPAEIHAVDVNPRQNALLELKQCLIQRSDHPEFFRMFGYGGHEYANHLYAAVRHQLSDYARHFWDRRIDYFRAGKKLRKSFYYHGTSGVLAWIMGLYLTCVKRRVLPDFRKLMACRTLAEQKAVYEKIETLLWDRFNAWLLGKPAILSMAGVPRPQYRLIDETYPGGVSRFIRDKLKHVFTEVPISSNYFWRVYLTGAYSPACCPNYLKKQNFQQIRENIHKIQLHTTSLIRFLEQYPAPYTHYVLLDHQDWLAGHAPEELQKEWELIFQNSRRKTKILFRSAGIDHSFLPRWVTSALRFKPEISNALHRQDRVGTYGSLHFAEIA